MKGLNWNGIIRSPYLVSSLNEALLHFIRDTVPKRAIVVRTGYKPWFDDRYVFAHRAKQRAYRVWIGFVARPRLIWRSMEWFAVVLSWSIEMMSKR